jgi:hypothetical protein
VQKDRREQNKGCVVEDGNREIQIPVAARRFVKVENKCDQTKRREMQDEWRATALLEDDKQANAEVNQSDEVDVKVTWRGGLNGAQIVEVGIVETHLSRKRRTFNQVVDLAADSLSLEIHLHARRVADRFATWAARDVFASIAVRTNSNQMIARNDSGSCGSGFRLNRLGNDALPGIHPSDAIPRR